MALRALSTGHPRTQRLLEAGRGLVAHREGPAVRALARAPLLAPTSHAGATSGPRPAEPRRPGLLVATTEPSKTGEPGAHRGRSPPVRIQRPPAGGAKAARPSGRHHRALEEGGPGGSPGKVPPAAASRSTTLADISALRVHADSSSRISTSQVGANTPGPSGTR